jgi:hypothetical protein
MKPSVTQALWRGHLTVTLPVLVIVALCGGVGRAAFGAAGLALGLLLGAVVAWPCWSFMVPRWRDWVEDQGIAPDEVQDGAVRTGLVWPRGSLLERTEFRRRDGRRGW